MELTATLAPRRAKQFTTARPMPREPPVTTATLSFSFRDSISCEDSKILLPDLRVYRCRVSVRARCARKLSTLFHEAREERLRQMIFLPAKFRMQLHSQHKAVAAGIFHCFDQAVRRPRRGDYFPSQSLYCLMMVTIHGHRRGSGEL